MAEISEDSAYRISGLYVTPNWNGNQDRVAMSCGIGATIKVLRKVGVVIAADPGATMARSWNMTARNTILRTAAKVYLYARVERNGANGMYIWSANIYDVEGYVNKVEDVHATNNEQYYYIRVGSLETDRVNYTIDFGDYGLNEDGEEPTAPSYNWDDLMKFDPVNGVIVFLYNLASVAFNSIILLGRELSYVLRGDDIKKEKNGNYITTEHEESDNAVVTGGFLKAWLGKISGNFLRKDKDDKTTHQLTIGKTVSNTVHSEGFREGGYDGKGVGMWQLMEDGEPVGYIESDYMTLRRAAYFRSITIAEVNHIGGEVILSQAACQIAFVEPIKNGDTTVAFRCYFEKNAGGREVYNQWRVGDQARCQRWDANAKQITGSFYWRVVVATSNDEGAEQVDDYHWIDLSNQSGQYASGSYEPMPNDNIVLLGHRGGIYDRTCAQVYSTIGSNAPSRRYYVGITSFTLPSPIERMEFERDPNDDSKSHAHWRIGDDRHYMDYSNKGLDIRTSSMTVIADGGDKEIDVAEVLGDSWSFFTTENEARKEGKEYVEWMAAAELVPNEADQWDSSVWKNYLNYQIITPYGITYKLDMNGDEVMWHLNTDRYLLHAQETADAAVKNLDDMASDDVITPQEKCQLRDEMSRAESDVEKLLEEATDTGLTVSQKESLDLWFKAFRTFANFILVNMDVSTELVNTFGYLTVYMPTKLSVPKIVRVSSYDNILYSTPVGGHYTFRQTYAQFYEWFGVVRISITRSILSTVRDILAGDITINEVVNARVDALHDEVAKNSQTVSSLDKEVTALANNVVYTDPVTGEQWDMFKGFLAADNFSSLFAYAYNDKGEMVVSSKVSTFVKKDKDGKLESGVSISADNIDFASGSVSVFTNDFVINSDGFTLTKEGNATFSGELKAATGTFGGKVSSEHGRSKFEIDPTLQSLSMKVALEYTESGEEVSTSEQVEILEIGTIQGTGSGTEGNMKYQRVAYVTCRSYNSLGQLYHVASIDGTDGFRSRYYDSSLNVTSEVDVSAQGVLLKGNAILSIENITTIDKDDADHRKYLLPGQVYRVKGERTLKINV